MTEKISRVTVKDVNGGESEGIGLLSKKEVYRRKKRTLRVSENTNLSGAEE